MPSRHAASSRLAGIVLALQVCALCSAIAQDEDPHPTVRADLRPGRTLEIITSVSDPSQHYALHLPSAYRPDRKWPVLLLMDPRGRAMIPLERFREAADRRGYALVSSYNTASDTGQDVNSPAVKAMLSDTPLLLSADEQRYYLVGFSGTARMSWAFAKMFPENVAGIIAFGGGLPLGHSAPWEATFAHFGAAGLFDFNFDEMVRLDANLDLREMNHTFESFAGGHQWGPADVCARAVDWMELMAMKAGRRPIDSAGVEMLYREHVAKAEALAAGRPYDAFLQMRGIVRDFGGLVEGSEMNRLTTALEKLESNPSVMQATEAQDEAITRYYRYKKRFADLLDAVEAGTFDPSAPAVIEALELDLLERRAAASAEDEAAAVRAQAARRLLEVVYVQCSFYLPRDYVRDGRLWAAVLALEVADAVHPLDLERFLDERGWGSLRGEPAFSEWVARRGR